MSPRATSAPSALSWLAGLLEAEGSFLRPPPSSPNSPIIACRITDRDVVERVASAFGVRVMSNPKGRHRTEYAATLKGANAVRLMRELCPMLGERRNRAIAAAIAAYEPPARKLSYTDGCAIRRRHADGHSVAGLASEFAVTRQTIYAVLQARIYRDEPHIPWEDAFPQVLGSLGPCSFTAAAELSWLAGWLEGEGSFLAPPPSDPRRPRVSGLTRDVDVAERVGCILGVTPTRAARRRSRERGWSPLFGVLCRGSRAIELMKAIEPIMGARRRSQIRRALNAVS